MKSVTLKAQPRSRPAVRCPGWELGGGGLWAAWAGPGEQKGRAWLLGTAPPQISRGSHAPLCPPSDQWPKTLLGNGANVSNLIAVSFVPQCNY